MLYIYNWALMHYIFFNNSVRHTLTEQLYWSKLTFKISVFLTFCRKYLLIDSELFLNKCAETSSTCTTLLKFNLKTANCGWHLNGSLVRCGATGQCLLLPLNDHHSCPVTVDRDHMVAVPLHAGFPSTAQEEAADSLYSCAKKKIGSQLRSNHSATIGGRWNGKLGRNVCVWNTKREFDFYLGSSHAKFAFNAVVMWGLWVSS